MEKLVTKTSTHFVVATIVVIVVAVVDIVVLRLARTCVYTW